MDPIAQFNREREENILKQGSDEKVLTMAADFIQKLNNLKYSYNFSWMGRPIIQYPQDIMAMQEIIWEVKPDLVIETGVAHGGSIIYYASLLELIGNNGIVVGIDIEIRKHNRAAIEAHPMFKRIKLIEASSTSEATVGQVAELAKTRKKVLVCLDSNHTHDHVLQELKLYTPFISVGSYCVVFDTIIENMPADHDWGEREWGKGNNAWTAVREFLKTNNGFIIDTTIDQKLLISVSPGGYLKRVK
jgi:cephalosporin hydroxylase